MSDQSWRLRGKCATDEAIDRMDDIVDSRTPSKIKNRRAAEFCYGCTVVREYAQSAWELGDSGVIAAGAILNDTTNSTPAKRRDLERLKAVAGV